MDCCWHDDVDCWNCLHDLGEVDAVGELNDAGNSSKPMTVHDEGSRGNNGCELLVEIDEIRDENQRGLN